MANKLQNLSVSELKAQRVDLNAKLERINSQIQELKISAHTLSQEVVRLDSEVARRIRVEPEPRLSDHALLRYIERVYNIDIEVIKAKIMTPTVIQAIKNGATAITVEGARFKIADNTVITVLNTSEAPRLKTGKGNTNDELKEGLGEYYLDK